MLFRVDRTYHLYARRNGRFEVVPEGWAPLVLLLGPFWAIANGISPKFFGAFLIALVPLAVAGLASETLGFGLVVFGVLISNAVIVFISLRANQWRQESLEAKGFERIASIRAESARQALRTWAISDQATSYLGNDA